MLAAPMFAPPGGWELVLIVFVLILLFGAKKLPDLARGTGRALRIFKSETRGLMDDDDSKDDATDDANEPRESRAAERDESPRSLTRGGSAEEQPQAAEPQPQGSEQANPTHRPYES